LPALAVPLCAAVALACLLPRHYRSTALVIVERGGGVDDDDLDARLTRLSGENLRRSRLRNLIASFDLYRELGEHTSSEVLIDQMQKDIKIETDHEERAGRNLAIAVHVTYTARDPRVAAQVANELAAFYEREDLRMRVQRSRLRKERLKAQLDDARQKLDEQAAALKNYKMRHLNELPEQVGLHLAALEQLNSQIRASQVGSDTPARPRTGSGAGAPATSAERDERIEKLRELETRYTPDHPDVKRLKREIAMLPLTSKNPSAAPQPGTISIEEAEAANQAEHKARVEDIQRRVEGLRQAAASHEQDILNAPARQQELEALLPDYVAARARFQTISEKYEIAALADPGHDDGALRLLDPAVPRAEAISPNVTRILAMGAGAAVAAALAVIVAFERMDTSFHTLADLRAFTRVPVLASLPRLESAIVRTRTRPPSRTSAAFLLLIVACILLAAAIASPGHFSLLAWLTRSHA